MTDSPTHAEDGSGRRGNASTARTVLALVAVMAMTPDSATSQNAKPNPAPSGPKAREITTSDGSRFLLVSDPRSAVIHWSIATPAGDLVDPPNFPGLAVAVARASLSGTDTIGTRSWSEESKVLRKIEQLEAERTEFIAQGGEPGEQLLADIERARRQLQSIRDEGEWLRELRAAPADDVELKEYTDACVLRLTTLPESFARVSYLLMDRRENARLRTIEADYADILASREAELSSDEVRLHREVRDLAYFGLAPRNTDDGAPSIDRALANATYERTQNPAATYNVIVGNFEFEDMRTLLERQFTVSNLPDAAAPELDPRRNSRSRRSTIDGLNRSGMAIAFELLADRPIVEQRIAAEWLAGGTGSYLAVQLRAAGFHGIEPVVRMPFPLSARPGFVLVELWQSAGADSTDPGSGLTSTVLKTIYAAPNAVNEGAIRRATARSALRLDVDRADPSELATWLAIECGVRGRDPAVALRPAPLEVDWLVQKKLVIQLFNDSNRIIVEMEKAR